MTIFTPLSISSSSVTEEYDDGTTTNGFLFSKVLYSLTFDSEYRTAFLTDYLKKSIYQYFLFQRDKYYSLKKSTSIFARKAQKDISELDIDYIQRCLNSIESEWV